MRFSLWLAILISLASSSVYAQQSQSGSEIFESRCTQCHKLPNIANRSPGQLSAIVDIMQQVMQARGITPLTDDEKTILLDYLLPQAKKEADERQEMSARDSFLLHCTLCHQAPEPEMLKFKQWKFVMMTMDQRMEQSNIPPLSEEERAEIMAYLKEHAR